MTGWAIEAEKLVKKFPFKPKDKNNGTATEAGGAEKKKRNPLRLLRKTEKQWLTAVSGVDLQIKQGEIFGLLGPNGAGKTTTIRMLCTLLEPSSGTARVNGFDIIKQARQVRQSLGTVLAGERSIYWKLSGRENLAYFAALYHIPTKLAQKRIDDLLERMELTDRANDLVEKYSSGMKQRIAISKALLARPPIILLDEPTLGLDPQAARQVRQLISELKEEGHTILLTTHYMEEADILSDRIGIIDQGKIIALDTSQHLKETIQQNDIIRLEIIGWDEAMGESLRQISEINNLAARFNSDESLWEINLHTSSSRSVLSSILDRVNHNGTRLVNMTVVKPTLEDVFIHLTGKALRD